MYLCIFTVHILSTELDVYKDQYVGTAIFGRNDLLHKREDLCPIV